MENSSWKIGPLIGSLNQNQVRSAVEGTEKSEVNQCGERQTARRAIEEMIERLGREQRQLQALLDALPAKLPPSADETLWPLLMRR